MRFFNSSHTIDLSASIEKETNILCYNISLFKSDVVLRILKHISCKVCMFQNNELSLCIYNP